jgi:hypothetical protein
VPSIAKAQVSVPDMPLLISIQAFPAADRPVAVIKNRKQQKAEAHIAGLNARLMLLHLHMVFLPSQIDGRTCHFLGPPVGFSSIVSIESPDLISRRPKGYLHFKMDLLEKLNIQFNLQIKYF